MLHSPEAATVTDTNRDGQFETQAWEGLHPLPKQRSAWIDHHQSLPIIEGAVIRVQSERLPDTGTPEPAWLWANARGVDDCSTVCGRQWLRWLDIEHTFRFLKQTLGWTVPQVSDPEADDRWTWLVIAAFTS